QRDRITNGPARNGGKIGEQRLSHRTPACKGNGDETDPKFLLKEFDRQRWRRAGPRGSDTELAGTGLHRVDQLPIVLAGKSRLTTKEFGEAPALVTGMRSFFTSKGILYRLGFTTMLDEANRIVYPPPAACAASATPILPPAPPMFST